MKLTHALEVLFVFVFCATGLLAQMGGNSTTNRAPAFNTLHNFDGTDGADPNGALVQATNGNLYGTTPFGGANSTCSDNLGCGTVFKITPSGTLTTLYSFCSQSNCHDGTSPPAALVQATNGNLYGTTLYGGATNSGTVFKITPSGTLTTLYSFCSQSNCADGLQPYAALVEGTNGNFYGSTVLGGAANSGTVFKITPSGTLTTLYSFCSQSNCADGAWPVAALVQATNGNLYGTTLYGGANGNHGTVFKITPSGTLTTLYSFCSQSNCTDGALPEAALVQATDGNFYGTTSNGGAAGTVFKITPSGTLTTLYSFCSQYGCTDGIQPYAALVQATDGNFYGTTLYGGDGFYYDGTVFEITPSGTLTTLHTFCTMQTGCPDGANPVAALVQATNGNLYGTTSYGGANGDGTVFSLSVGLGPFVETRPTSGKVGAKVIILGTNLTGTSIVSFHGKPATFKVVSRSEIKTAVPARATTGKIKVKTPHGTLLSNVPFRVLP